MSATVTWLGHGTIRLTLPDGRVIMIDPWLAENPACPDNLKKPSRCDMIFLSHGHFDHAGDVESLIEKFDPMVVGNFDLCAALETQIGKGRYSGMNTGGTQTVDGVSVSLTPALHSSAVPSPNGPLYAGMPNGVVVFVDGLATVYHAGDTDVFGDMKLIAQLFEPKICILPIGDYFTMGARGAAIAAQMLQPTAIIPVHYKTFPVLAQSADEFREALSGKLKDRLVVAEVGQELAWTASGIG
jgi:L-ascorbate metabolism protein UlaG (beta-lactamase superfamily)